MLYQNGQEANRYDLTDPQKLCDLLNEFFAQVEPEHDKFEHAVEDFKERVPDLAKGLLDRIKKAHEDNPKFQKAFDDFFSLCQQPLGSPASVLSCIRKAGKSLPRKLEGETTT